jgi:DNA polymerase-4
LVTRRGPLLRPSDDDRTLYEASRKQLDRVDLGRPVRLTGISVSDFVGPAEPPQLGLFAAPKGETTQGADDRRDALNAALDAIADRFGDEAVVRADLSGRRRRRSDGGVDRE